MTYFTSFWTFRRGKNPEKNPEKESQFEVVLVADEITFFFWIGTKSIELWPLLDVDEEGSIALSLLTSMIDWLWRCRSVTLWCLLYRMVRFRFRFRFHFLNIILQARTSIFVWNWISQRSIDPYFIPSSPVLISYSILALFAVGALVQEVFYCNASHSSQVKRRRKRQPFFPRWCYYQSYPSFLGYCCVAEEILSVRQCSHLPMQRQKV